MNTYSHIPYTYLIGWSTLDKYYYGVQYGDTANPRNLWVTYFTSSGRVAAIRRQHGEPDVIQVRKCFCSSNEASNWEAKALSRIQNKHRYINQRFGTFKNMTATPETRHKLSESNRRRVMSSETKAKLSYIGSTRSLETRRKISVAKTGKTHTLETKLKISNARRGISRSDDTRAKISKSMTGKVRGPHKRHIAQSTVEVDSL